MVDMGLSFGLLCCLLSVYTRELFKLCGGTFRCFFVDTALRQHDILDTFRCRCVVVERVVDGRIGRSID